MFWPGGIPVFCLLSNGYDVYPNIIATVTQNLNLLLLSEVFKIIPSCDICNENQACNTLEFGPTSSGASATTTYKINMGSILKVSVVIDTRIVQSAGLFHNVLLHEFVHVLGFQHNYTVGSIMNFTVKIRADYSVIQKVDFVGLHHLDIASIQSLNNYSQWSYLYKFPKIRAYHHVSGKSKYILPETCPILQTKDNLVSKYWKFKPWYYRLHRKRIN